MVKKKNSKENRFAYERIELEIYTDPESIRKTLVKIKVPVVVCGIFPRTSAPWF